MHARAERANSRFATQSEERPPAWRPSARARLRGDGRKLIDQLWQRNGYADGDASTADDVSAKLEQFLKKLEKQIDGNRKLSTT